MFAMGAGLLGTAVISNRVYFISICYEVTLQFRAGYTLVFCHTVLIFNIFLIIFKLWN